MIFDLNGNPTCKCRFIHVKASSYMRSLFISNISKDTNKIPLQTKINIVYKEKFCRKEKNVYLCIAEEKSSLDAALAEGKKSLHLLSYATRVRSYSSVG